ncbi:hypothetical protein C8R43DRAFT_570812 [Mycena crocata]|nr:hypothetical protein C8R43DRAFT_570812 [Mycena crocata]
MALDQSLLTYGVELAGSWVNMMLYMLELVMCIRYFQRCSRPLPHRIGVGALVLFDTLCTITVNANVFMTFLCLLGKKALTSLSIPTSVMIFLTYLTATCEQLFLCQLYFILTRNRLISLFLAFLAVLHFSFSFAAGIMVQTTPFAEFPTTSFIELPTFTVTASAPLILLLDQFADYFPHRVGAILCALSDLLIAGCLGYEFFKIKTNAASTKSLFGRIYILSIASGAIVASNTLIMMILFLNYNIVFEFFFFCQGRVYALTLLVNFLSGPSSSATSPSHDIPQSSVVFCEHTHPSVFSGMGGTRPPPSIYSHYVRHF